VLTAALIASNQRKMTHQEHELPMRTVDRWIADAVSSRDASYGAANANRDDNELARRLGREASATVRERASAARRALRPAFGVTIRVRA
jgi:hypothetical protein